MLNKNDCDGMSECYEPFTVKGVRAKGAIAVKRIKKAQETGEGDVRFKAEKGRVTKA